MREEGAITQVQSKSNKMAASGAKAMQLSPRQLFIANLLACKGASKYKNHRFEWNESLTHSVKEGSGQFAVICSQSLNISFFFLATQLSCFF